MKSYPITPVAKPRMTRSDRWKKRPATSKYWAFVDDCKKLGLKFYPGDGVRFVIPMPKSYSKKKRAYLLGRPHTIKPDLSNLLKALEDAVWPGHDQMLWKYSFIEKVWGEEGKIIIFPEM